MSFCRSLRSRRRNLAHFCDEELEQLRNKHRGIAAAYENELIVRNSPVLSESARAYFEECSIDAGLLHLRIDTHIPCEHEWVRHESVDNGAVHPRYECQRCHTFGYGCVEREE